MKIVHIITGLNTGGAEMMLYKLLSQTDRQTFDPTVISLLEFGPVAQKIMALDILVYTIGMKRTVPTPAQCISMIKLIRRLSPDILQGWMYHGNLAALISSFFVKRPAVCWNIRQSLDSLSHEKKSTAHIIRLGAVLSGFPKIIIYNAHKSAQDHERIGYKPTKSKVIPNGFDTEVFRPNNNVRAISRSELKIPADALIIGLIGRYHPMKDHKNFLHAASILLQQHENVYFVLAGRGIDNSNAGLMSEIFALGIRDRIFLLGERHDIPELTAALDIATTSSRSEGFSNVIGEAMSCGVPCVVTDVGDSAWIVGETGRVAPPADPAALAQAWGTLIELGEDGRRALGTQARQRVIDNFSLDAVVKQYENLYEEVYSLKMRR